MCSQIYVEFVNCLLPGAHSTKSALKSSFALMRWPNGKPCSLINFWLTDLSRRTTGKTIKQYCVNLTPFVRFCHRKKIALLEFCDEDMVGLVFEITEEIQPGGERKKQNNQVNAVIDSILAFFIWAQENADLNQNKKLIGEIAVSPNITIVFEHDRFGRRIAKHECHVPISAPLHAKNAMPRTSIKAIEDQIFLESDPELYPGSGVHKYNSNQKKMLFKQKYLFERRTITIWMMKHIGLRPEELTLIPLPTSRTLLQTLVIHIPTKKRRTNDNSLRPFKLTNEGALCLAHYLDARDEFLQHLGELSPNITFGKAILLTESGGMLSAASLTRDFSRLTKRAGLSDVRVCFSMFRHRFITMEILIYMKEIFNTDRPSRHMLTKAIAKSVEERIRKKTGHKLGKSIWSYFDAAFDAMKFWNSVEQTIDNFTKINDLEDSLSRLRYDTRNASGSQAVLLEQIAVLQREVSNLRSQLNIGD